MSAAITHAGSAPKAGRGTQGDRGSRTGAGGGDRLADAR